MRGYIFTDHKLDAMWEYIRAGRNRTFDKLIHYAHEQRRRLPTDLELLIGMKQRLLWKMFEEGHSEGV